MGVIAHGRGSFIYTTFEDVGHDANLTIECIQRTLKHLEKQGSLPRKMHIQLDNVTGGNKNKYLLAYLDSLVDRQVFEEVQLSFLPVGHTHEDIDQLFSRISIHLRRVDCLTYKQFRQAMARCYSPHPLVERIDKVANYKDYCSSR